MAVLGAVVTGGSVVGSAVGLAVGKVVGVTGPDGVELATARMIRRRTPTVHSAESTIPAMAMPRPFCPVRLVWLSAMNPKMNPSSAPPMMPKISAAIAKPLVPWLGGAE